MHVSSNTHAQVFATILFVAAIGSAGTVQTVAEIWRGERLQVLELFDDLPSAASLRTFERRLEEKSLVTRIFRPWAQYGQFLVLGDAGDKALLGREGWFFYRPAYRYLMQRKPVLGQPPAPVDPVPAIVSFHQQLKSRGIHLLVLPVPNKISIHPEMLTRRVSDDELALSPRTEQLLGRLDAAGVDVVDLFEVFRQAKQAHRGRLTKSLYMAQDTHWSPEGLRLAAEEVASRVIEHGEATRGKTPYRRRPVTIERFGDVVEMLSAPQIERFLGPERVECQQVVNRDTGVPYQSDPQAEILVLGDSFLRVFEREAPGSAGFVAQLACELQQPLASIINDGGGSTLVRQELARSPQLLENKKVVLWEFVERDILDGTEGWQEVNL